MEELRPDTLGQEITPSNQSDVDNRVIAPGEFSDGRTDDQPDFELVEELSGAGTGYDPTDPAEGEL